jgi:hypothetical protein
MSRSQATLVREVERKVRLQDADLENRQKVWRRFLLTAMALLLCETWLAGRTARHAAAAATVTETDQPQGETVSR